MARIYRTFEYPAGGLNNAAVLDVFTQLKADIEADPLFSTHLFNDGSYDYLFFWPAQHGSTPDYTNDDVPIWCLNHSAGFGDIPSKITMFPYRGDPTAFDGMQTYSDTEIIRSAPTRYDPHTNDDVPAAISLLYAIASDVPIVAVSAVMDVWDWSAGEAGQGVKHVVAAPIRRIAADMSNGIATRYGVAEIKHDGYWCMNLGGALDENGVFDVFVYPELWSPIPFLSLPEIAGQASPVGRTAVSPIYPVNNDSNAIRLIFGEVAGMYCMAGKPLAFPEVIAPGLMAVGPVTGAGVTLAIPACEPASE